MSKFKEFLKRICTEVIAELQVDVSVVAMSKIEFEIQPIPFADKVYFTKE